MRSWLPRLCGGVSKAQFDRTDRHAGNAALVGPVEAKYLAGSELCSHDCQQRLAAVRVVQPALALGAYVSGTLAAHTRRSTH